MSVDRNKVLYGNPIKAIRIKHRALTEKPSITREDARTYYEAYADKPMSFTLEASRYIFSEPISGLNYYKEYVENHTIPLFALREESAKLDEYISNFKEYFSPGTLVRYEAVSEMLHNKINGLKNSILLSEGADKSEEMKARIAESGVTVLEGEGQTVVFHGQPIHICDIDDPAVGTDVWQAQLASAARGAAGEGFSILLTHRPERTSAYEGQGFDLILAGHAHGGQWRIPFLLNGLLAPNQGFFPAFAGGRYELGETTLIVSRGLARESTRVPRIFNPPEVVVIDLTPAEGI